MSTPSSDYPIQPVPFTSVRIHDKFWAPKIETNRAVTIPYAFKKCEESGRMFNFERAAKALKGIPFEDKRPPGYPFDDTDVYKVLEGASYALNVKKDPKLEAYVDKIVALIASAQEPDGYLYTTRTLNPEHPHDWSGKERWINEEDNSHELYDLGHLYEAAVAHYQATGKKTLLNVAIKSADLLLKTFGPGKRKIYPGHQIIEMGLVKLSRVTGKKEYIDLAKFMLDCRGGSGEYWQAHKPPVDQTEAVGHAVRASYMYSGMADIAAVTGDKKYAAAIDTLWDNVVTKKLYITGGIGATGAGEAFGGNYDLPNMSAYCETCAAIGNDYWNDRLFLLHGDAKYVDVFERTLYNGLISGVSLDGTHFFYPNPLESRGQHARAEWFGCACCPGNITRFMASIPGYFYGQRGSEVFVNLFAESTAELKLPKNTALTVEQHTEYPWDGKIRISLSPSKATAFALKVRVPGWALEQAVPSTLYRYADGKSAAPTFSLNGRPIQPTMNLGYAVFNRTWKKGDYVEMNLPMPVRRIKANAKVSEDKGKIALQRGPIVYCAEGTDQAGGSTQALMLPDTSEFKVTVQPNLLGGVTTISSTAEELAYQKDGSVAKTSRELVAIPYYAWANRGRGEMRVWFPNSLESAKPKRQPTVASLAKIRTSGGNNPAAINDLIFPNRSSDPTSFFHWWPKKGTTEWVEMTFAKPTEVGSSSVYWFDDTGVGECRPPRAWRLLYKDGDSWKPVESTTEFGTMLDTSNQVSFKPVTTSALRMEIDLQKNWSAGIQEWEVK